MVALIIGAMLCELLFGLCCVFWLREYWRRQKRASFTTAQPTSLLKELGALWKAKPPAGSTQPLGSIPRGGGSWRRQRLELQRQHNTKQKERDALGINPLQEKRNVASQTR